MNGRVSGKVMVVWLALMALALAGFARSPARAESGAVTVQLTDVFRSEFSGERETSIGDVVADSVRHAADAQVALVDAEALQPLALNKGPVKVARFRDALSYPADSISVLKLKGDVLVNALERSVSYLPQSNPGFLQVSGLAFTVNSSAHPGSRTGKIFLLEGKALDRTSTYKVAMPQSLAQGANGYFLIWGGVPSQNVSQTLGEAVTAFVSAHDTLSPSLNRIVP